MIADGLDLMQAVIPGVDLMWTDLKFILTLGDLFVIVSIVEKCLTIKEKIRR